MENPLQQRPPEGVNNQSDGYLPIELAGITLLRAVRDTRRNEIEADTRAYVQQLVEAGRIESLDALLDTDVKNLQSLQALVHTTENNYYYSRKGKHEAIELLAKNHIALNPRISKEAALQDAEKRLKTFKSAEGKRVNHRTIGKAMLAPLVELPPVAKVEGEFIGTDDTDVYSEQAYQLRFEGSDLHVKYLASDASQANNVVAIPQFILKRNRLGKSLGLITPDSQPASDQDKFFVLGLVQETSIALEQRLSVANDRLSRVGKVIRQLLH